MAAEVNGRTEFHGLASDGQQSLMSPRINRNLANRIPALALLAAPFTVAPRGRASQGQHGGAGRLRATGILTGDLKISAPTTPVKGDLHAGGDGRRGR
jgi:hypothetical protein